MNTMCIPCVTNLPFPIGKKQLCNDCGKMPGVKSWLFLSRKQFPGLPTTTPVIPAWQLQQNSAEAETAESRAEMNNSTTTELENCTDTKPSLTTAVETGRETIDTVKDKLEMTQSELIQVNKCGVLFGPNHQWSK